MNCIIIHGSNSDEKGAKIGGVENTRHWHPWLKRQLEEKGIKVSGELYPFDWKPDYKQWKNIFEKNKIDENTILVGHSAGCAFLLRWLSEKKRKVRKLILVAPYIIDSPKAPFLSDLVNFEINKDIKNCFDVLIIFYSDNDNKDIIDSAVLINKKLGGKIIRFKDRGHFTLKDMKTEKFPELLDAILK